MLEISPHTCLQETTEEKINIWNRNRFRGFRRVLMLEFSRGFVLTHRSQMLSSNLFN